jgi:hypothetical protein
MGDDNAKRFVAKAVNDDGGSFLAGRGIFSRFSKDSRRSGKGREELNTGEIGASGGIGWLDSMRDALILKHSLEATEPKAEIGILVAVKFREEKFKVCHGWRECEELWERRSKWQYGGVRTESV